jgi:guanylate kinase
LSQNPDLVLSVSATTRQPRPGETHGEDYYFMSQADFVEKTKSNEFYEWAQVFDHYYGTPKGPVEEALEEGRDVVFDIDWQGAQALAESAPDDVVRVFILPPSLKLLRDRLVKRAQDSDEVIEGRMNRAKAEIEHWAEYDYVVVNDDFSRALEKLSQILHAERLKRSRHPWLEGFVDVLMDE